MNTLTSQTSALVPLKSLVYSILSLFRGEHNKPFDKEIIYPEVNCFNSDDLFNLINIFDPSHPEFKILAGIIKSHSYEIKDFDICAIASFAESKSKSSGLRFPSVYAFGESVYNGTGWSIDECIKNLRSHAASIDRPLDLIFYRWNHRFAWDNGDGSHHMATAIFHLINNPSLPRLYHKVHIKENFIDVEIVEKILHKHSFFIISSKSWFEIYKYYRDVDGIHYKRIANGMFIISIRKKNLNRKCKKLLSLCESQRENVCINLNRYINDRLFAQSFHLL